MLLIGKPARSEVLMDNGPQYLQLLGLLRDGDHAPFTRFIWPVTDAAFDDGSYHAYEMSGS